MGAIGGNKADAKQRQHEPHYTAELAASATRRGGVTAGATARKRKE
jgi:hypothetical protein